MKRLVVLFGFLLLLSRSGGTIEQVEVTLCIGNKHVLKLFSFDHILNSETYRP